MKHLKTYENEKNEGCYWLVPTDDRFKKSLIEIGCPRNKMYDYLNNPGYKIKKYIFIACYNIDNKDDKKEWGWNEFSGELGDHIYDDVLRLPFGGIVNIEDYELDAMKYNL